MTGEVAVALPMGPPATCKRPQPQSHRAAKTRMGRKDSWPSTVRTTESPKTKSSSDNLRASQGRSVVARGGLAGH